MTERLYYQNSFLYNFTASVAEEVSAQTRKLIEADKAVRLQHRRLLGELASIAAQQALARTSAPGALSQ